MKTFAKLLKEYAFLADLNTVPKLLDEFSLFGCFFDESLLYKWRSGSRRPTSREIVIVLIQILSKRINNFSVDDANLLLASLDYRDLESTETTTLNLSDYTHRLSVPQVIQPYSLLEEEIRHLPIEVKSLEGMKSDNAHYYDQIITLLSHYYAYSSLGRRTVEDVYKMQVLEDYEHPYQGVTFIALCRLPHTSEPCIAGSFRFMTRDMNFGLLEIEKFFNSSYFQTHNLAELDRFYIAEWAIGRKEEILFALYEELTKWLNRQSQMLIAQLSPVLAKSFNETDILNSKLEDYYFTGNHPNAKSLFPDAYNDTFMFPIFWNKYNSIYTMQ